MNQIINFFVLFLTILLIKYGLSVTSNDNENFNYQKNKCKIATSESGSLKLLELCQKNGKIIYPPNSKNIQEIICTKNCTLISNDDISGYFSLNKLILNYNEIGCVNISKNLFAGLPNLQKLNLFGNEIGLPTTIFGNDSQVTNIFFEVTKLKNINPKIFYNLHKLRVFSINTKNFTNLKFNIFKNLNTLKVLELNGPIRLLMSDTLFRSLINLKSINLSKNIDLFKLPSRLLADFEHLENVKIEFNRLNRLPEDLFSNSSKIRSIGLQGNVISLIPENLFKGLFRLRSINLNSNNISNLPDKIFQGLYNLNELDLSGNSIKIINDKILNKIPIKSLNIRGNGLIDVHYNAFRHCNLNFIDLSENNLNFNNSEKLSPFRHCRNLIDMVLNQNKIGKIFDDWKTFKSLEMLDLKNNLIEYIQSEDLFFSKNNIIVFLNNNKIKQIDFSNMEKIVDSYAKKGYQSAVEVIKNPIECDFKIYDLLRYIKGDMKEEVIQAVKLITEPLYCQEPADLRGKSIHNISYITQFFVMKRSDFIADSPCGSKGQCNCLFRPHDKTLIMNCSNRNLSVAPNLTDTYFAHEIILNMRRNNLKEIPDLKRPGFDKVVLLDLSDNQITNVTENILFGKLKKVRLNNNNISFIEKEILINYFNKSRIIKIYNNTWDCNCDTYELLSHLIPQSYKSSKYKKFTCFNSRTPLFEFEKTDICPVHVDYTIIILSIIVSICSFLVSLIIALFFKYNFQIKAYLYSMNWCLGWITENDLDQNKEFDIFLSYCYEDEEFTMREILPRLEQGEKTYKVCVHSRDWLAGLFIEENIFKSIKASKRTVIVLSNNFINSIWGMLELRAAYNEMMREKRSRIIVILFEDLKNLDSEVKTILGTVPCISIYDHNFWRKLIYLLPHN